MSVAGSRAELTARLTAPGQEFEVAERTIRGVPMRVYTRGPQTLRELVLNTTAFGDHDFLIYQDERRSFAEHLRLASGLAHCLLDEYGLRRGDRVAVSMRNYPEWAPVFWATQLAGLVVVPLNAWWSAPELCYALTDSGARLLVADAERIALLAPRRDELGRIPLVEVRGAGRPAPGVRGWDELVGALPSDADEPDVTVTPDDDATILYTSGTTGSPKGAIGTHRNHCTNTRNMVLGATVSAALANGGTPPLPNPDAPRPGTLCTFPFFHIAGINALCVTIALGARLATLYRWDREQAREMIRRERLTTASGVPTLMRQLVEDGGGLDSLATIGMGGTSIPPDLIGRIDAEFGSLVAPGNGYGLTETTSAVATNTGADYVARPDSVGRCVPGTDVRVVDSATGADLPDGEVGELWFRGPNVVRGYWNNPAATEEAFTDGWFHSGDLGRVRDGWIYVVDRLKDVVIRGGENIYCTEVEAALFEHPAVADVAVVGVPDATYGERAVAVVVAAVSTTTPATTTHSTAEELRRHVAERLAAFKVPDHVIFRTEPLPRTQSGKVLKRDLRTELTEGRPHGA